jgi:hypothetical protein
VAAQSLSPSSQTVSAQVNAALTATSALSASNFTGTPTYSISPALPAGLSLNTGTGVISGTPTASQAATSHTITATSGTQTATATVSLTVGKVAQIGLVVSINPLVLSARQAGVMSVSGGSGSGTVSYAVSSGTCTLSGHTLTAGVVRETCVVLATKAADASYLASTASLSVTVSGRISLSQALDATVRGAMDAQSEGSSRMVQRQMGSVSEHLQRLAQSFDLRGSRISFRTTDPDWNRLMQASQMVQYALASTGARSLRQEPEGVTGHLGGVDLGGSVLDQRSMVLAGRPELGAQSIPSVDLSSEQGSAGPALAWWVSGDFGRTRQSGGVGLIDSESVTLGMDLRLLKRTIIGFALGRGKEHSKTDKEGTVIKAGQNSMSVYGLSEVAQGWLFDAQLGRGDLAFENRRYSGSNAVFLQSERRGHSWFGGLGLSAPVDWGALRVVPFLRWSLVETRLNAYAESGDANALSYGGSKVQGRSWQLGSRMAQDFSVSESGRWTGEGRFEMRRSISGSMTQQVSFSDPNSPDVALMQVDAVARHFLGVGAGIRHTYRSGVSTGLQWDWMGGGGLMQQRLSLQWRFPL